MMSPTREAHAHQPVVIRILVSRIHYDKHCESARLCDSLMKGATGVQCCWCADLLRTVRGGGSRLGVLRETDSPAGGRKEGGRQGWVWAAEAMLSQSAGEPPAATGG